ncbi:alpha/beta fold hydrolase [Microlunatus elymi]|uniref:Alpha/beta fold hydrolase n=1 Tax=Microlunatus elymi TaxID=2596828 RepID=A0A516Q2H8_9ACTN|nr:alpha/beta fold hydrolase [Microlunatus elymi]QDP97626.1 alpha/beta fold hydrolase [Microlunatus elymi]
MKLLPRRKTVLPQPATVRPGTDAYAAGDGSIGVLLIHGFTGSPASMRPWAEQLAAAGYRVRVPRLPGHGTSWQELNLTRWQDWYATVKRSYADLSVQTDKIVVCGLSLGGALALRLAARQRVRERRALHRSRRPGRPAEQSPTPLVGLCLVNPALHNADPRLPLLPLLKHLTGSVAGISNDIARPFADELAYNRTPLRALASMVQLWDLTIAGLHRVDQPILLFRSRHDHVVGPTSARILHERVSSTDVTEHELQKSFHVATLDYDADFIVSESLRFIRRVTSS